MKGGSCQGGDMEGMLWWHWTAGITQGEQWGGLAVMALGEISEEIGQLSDLVVNRESLY